MSPSPESVLLNSDRLVLGETGEAKAEADDGLSPYLDDPSTPNLRTDFIAHPKRGQLSPYPRLEFGHRHVSFDSDEVGSKALCGRQGGESWNAQPDLTPADVEFLSS